MHKIGNFTIRQCWYIIVTLLIPFICVGGSTYFPYHLRLPLIIVVAAGSFIISVATSRGIKLNLISIMWLAVSLLICVSSLNSYDSENTFQFGLIFLLSTLLLFVDFPEKVWEKVILISNIFVIVIAVSIIASVFVDRLMINQFRFIVNPSNFEPIDQQIIAELNLGAYSGFVGEKAEAALIMNVGLAVISSKFFSGTKCKAADIAELILVAVALILTGKRMLFIIPVMIFIIMMLMSSIKSKFLKFFVIALLAVCGVIVASAFIPQMQVLYDRFIGNASSKYYDPLSGRGDLWQYSFMMFAENPILGIGYGSYNKFAYDNGYLYYGQIWRYYGHNCYYELLGEVGIIGAVLIFGLLIAVLVATVRLLRNNSITLSQRRLLMFSFYIQVMLLIYCVSANVLFQTEQIFMWFTAMSMVLTIYKQVNVKTIPNNCGRSFNNHFA